MTDLPIACTLTPDGMAARMALIDALAADGLLDRTPTAAGLRVRLRDTPEIEQRTRELVAAGSTCCAFLDFEVSPARGGHGEAAEGGKAATNERHVEEGAEDERLFGIYLESTPLVVLAHVGWL